MTSEALLFLLEIVVPKARTKEMILQSAHLLDTASIDVGHYGPFCVMCYGPIFNPANIWQPRGSNNTADLDWRTPNGRSGRFAPNRIQFESPSVGPCILWLELLPELAVHTVKDLRWVGVNFRGSGQWPNVLYNLWRMQ